jgi:hypothetical protein
VHVSLIKGGGTRDRTTLAGGDRLTSGDDYAAAWPSNSLLPGHKCEKSSSHKASHIHEERDRCRPRSDSYRTYSAHPKRKTWQQYVTDVTVTSRLSRTEGEIYSLDLSRVTRSTLGNSAQCLPPRRLDCLQPEKRPLSSPPDIITLSPYQHVGTAASALC